MAIAINGAGTITGITAGGLPDASVIAADIAADSVDGTKIADNAINSEHYTTGSIDAAHLANDAVTIAKLAATGTASSSTFLRGDNAWAAPAGGGGKIVQVVNVTNSAVATGTSRFYADDTIPQNTEGDEFMTLAITPASASNKLIIRSEVNLASSGAQRYFVTALFQDSTANALTVVIGGHHDALTGSPDCVTSQHYMVAGTTSSTTFKVRGGTANTGTTTLNGAIGARFYGGVYGSSLTIWEIEA